MGRWLTAGDLAPFASIDQAKAEAMIDDAEAMAAHVAPCLISDATASDEVKLAVIRAVLRGAVLRWAEASDPEQSRPITTGPFTVGASAVKESRKSLFWPSEVVSLREVCATPSDAAGRAGMVDMTGLHGPSPHVLFGALVNGPNSWAPRRDCP